MKKILIATTALALSAGAASAADPITGAVNGYLFMGAGLTDAQNPSGDTEVAILRDGEIHLAFRGNSDNGLTFDGRLELEMATTGDQVDENWGRVSGSFGSILIGSNDTASNNFGEVGNFCAAGCRFAYFDGFGVVPGETNYNSGFDALGIRYATPSIAGFTAAVSYHPKNNIDGANDSAYSTSTTGIPGQKDVVSLAANYSADFGAAGFALSGGYTMGDNTVAGGTDLEIIVTGLEISFSGFTLGGIFQDSEGVGGQAGETFVLGGQYGTGPWTIAGGGSFSDRDNGDEAYKLAGWVSYALAPGATGTLGLEYGELDTGAATADGYNAMAAIALSF